MNKPARNQIANIYEKHQEALRTIEKLQGLLRAIYVGPMAYFGEKLKMDKETKRMITNLLDQISDAMDGKDFDEDSIIPFHPTVIEGAGTGERTSPAAAKLAGAYLAMKYEDFASKDLTVLHEDMKKMAGSLVTQAPNKRGRKKSTA